MSATATIHTQALGGAPRSPAQCQIVVVEGPDMGRATDVVEPEVVVGTDPSCGLVLTDEGVSRRHFSVRPAAGRFVIRDLESRNGTLYEGSKLAEATVPAGATIKVGHSFVRLQPKPQAFEVPPSQARRFGEMVAESLVMREVFAVLELAADSDATVLLEGETGVGKELAARAVHAHGSRRSKPFVAVDSGSLPSSLVESELFGHVRGAFTGASSARAGAFVRADGGTLFLDELDSIPLPVQARLLRVLEERRVKPVGGDDERSVDFRVVAAARRDLRTLVAEGAFRPDLYYRLSVVRVVIPPLRERREDLGPVVAEMLRARGFDDPGPIAGPNLERLMVHDWPGNARELRNVIDRAVALTPAARSFADLRITVGPTAAPADPLAIRTDLPFSEAKQAVVDGFERRYLRDLYDRCDGNISAAARQAGIDRKHLRTLLVRHGLLPES